MARGVRLTSGGPRDAQQAGREAAASGAAPAPPADCAQRGAPDGSAQRGTPDGSARRVPPDGSAELTGFARRARSSRRSRLERWAWPMVALLLGVPTLLSGIGPALAIDWQPQRWAAEPWRWWSCAWVHYTAAHRAGNLAGLMLVAALGVLARVPFRGTLAWLLAWPLTPLPLLLLPTLAHYGGLSGVLHAGVVVAALWLALGDDPAKTRRERWVGAALLFGTVLKIALEQPWSATLPHSALLGITVVPLAHAGGAFAGALVFALWRMRLRGPRR